MAAKDLKASRAFDEQFGFKAFAGHAEQSRLTLKNGDFDWLTFGRPVRKRLHSWLASGNPAARGNDLVQDEHDSQQGI